MGRIFAYGLLIAVALFGADVRAETVSVRRDASTNLSRGTVISALGLDSARWTGWINVRDDESIVFSIAFTDANSSVTAVTMVCETSSVGSTTNDAGYDLHVLSIASGTATSTPITWSYTTAGSKKWTWTVANIPDKWLNCKFDATGTPASIDVVTVVARGMTP